MTDVNVLMVYAMCNLCDVTRTGGDNNVVKDFGGIMKVQGKGETGEMTALLSPTSEKPPEHPRDGSVVMEWAHQDRNIRTNIPLVWLGTNAILIIAFTTSAFFPWINNEVGSTRGSEAYLAFFYLL